MSMSITNITVDLNHTNGKGPTSICRKMIREGSDPDQKVAFYRGTTPVFSSRSLGSWASYRVREADGSGPMRFEKVTVATDCP